MNLKKFQRGWGQFVAQKRHAHGMTLRELAAAAHLAHPRIWETENSRRNPRLTELFLLASAFDISAERMLSEFVRFLRKRGGVTG